MVKSLVAVLNRCTGCRLCELACAYRRYKSINPSRARIHVVRLDHEPVDAPMFCAQCGLCIGACPLNAIKRNLKTGAIIVDEEKCTGCGQCVHVCPYGVATIDPASKKASICDLCGGEPECVKICPENALIYVDSEKAAVYKRLTFSRLQRKELTPYAPYP